MKTTIICTVGTSTLEKTKPKEFLWLNPKKNPLDYEHIDDLDLLCQNYTYERLNDYEPLIEDFTILIKDITNLYLKKVIQSTNWTEWDYQELTSKWRLLPAEVASTLRIIQKLNVEPEQVEIVLIISDTGHSYACAQIIREIFNNLGFSVSEEHMKQIPGFQMENIERFSSVGLPNFITAIKDYMTEEDEGKQVFNITGGYKNFIPLVTHIASFYRKDMYYVFEEAVSMGSDSIIKVPRIPTLNRILKAKTDDTFTLVHIINKVENGNCCSEDDAYEIIQYILNKMLEVSPDLVEEYSLFLLDLFVQNNGKFEISIMGKVYLMLIDNIQDELNV